MSKPKKKKEEDVYYITVGHDMVPIRVRIANKIIEVLREYPLLGEKDLVLRLITEDPKIKEYYKKTQSIAYIRSVLWELVRKKMVLKAKVLGDNKHVYFFLPEQLEKLKGKMVMSPKETTTSTTVNISTSSNEEEEWEEDDKWMEECIKNGEC